MARQENPRVIFELLPEGCFDSNKFKKLLLGRHTEPIKRRGQGTLFYCGTPTFCPEIATIENRGSLGVNCPIAFHSYEINLPTGLGIKDMIAKMMISLMVSWEQYHRTSFCQNSLKDLFGEVVLFDGPGFTDRPAFGGFELTAYNGSDTTKARLYFALPDNNPKCFSEFASWALTDYMIRLVELERAHKEGFKWMTIV